MSRHEYIPGVCNIGPAEIRQRKNAGWLGLFVAVLLWVSFASAHAAHAYFLLIGIPATVAATGFIQSYTHFCANFGMKGVFNFGSELGKTENSMQQEFRIKDRRKALLIIFSSLAIGIVVAVIAFLT